VLYATGRYRQEIMQELRRAFLRRPLPPGGESNAADLLALDEQIQYHLGLLDAAHAPVGGNPGKLLRPILLLLAYESAGGSGLTGDASPGRAHLQRALPAAATVELLHNATLVHDDIEDGDVERHHLPTVWFLWGIPKGIVVGDALFALARKHLWEVLDAGVEPTTAARLAQLLDATILTLTEGQHLDLSFEQRQRVSLASYEDMISRKTAALMRCSTWMGAILGTSDQEVIMSLARFGHALGLAFQVRDDMLGVWATAAESGKRPAGDIYRRKKSLPVLHALQHAQPADQRVMMETFGLGGQLTQGQAQEVLAVFARAQTREYCQRILAQYCCRARQALAQVTAPGNARPCQARADLEALIDYVEAECYPAADGPLRKGFQPGRPV
jgi:geranylgeranyl diphosphate synthase type I